MKSALSVFIVLILVGRVYGAAKYISFNDLNGNTFSNVTVLAVEKDGVLLKFGEESKYTRVKFTNMTEDVQVLCGYDAKKVAKERELRAERERQAYEASFLYIRQSQTNELLLLAVLAEPISQGDFPETEAIKKSCKEIAAELNGLNTAIEQGLSYTKYADMVTDTAIKIQKIKDLAGHRLPAMFQIRADACMKAHTDARKHWQDHIYSESESRKKWAEYFQQRNWSEAGIHYSMIAGMIDGRTNVNEEVIPNVAALVRREKLAVESGVLPSGLRRYENLALLSDEEVGKRLSEAVLNR